MSEDGSNNPNTEMGYMAADTEQDFMSVPSSVPSSRPEPIEPEVSELSDEFVVQPAEDVGEASAVAGEGLAESEVERLLSGESSDVVPEGGGALDASTVNELLGESSSSPDIVSPSPPTTTPQEQPSSSVGDVSDYTQQFVAHHSGGDAQEFSEEQGSDSDAVYSQHQDYHQQQSQQQQPQQQQQQYHEPEPRQQQQYQEQQQEQGQVHHQRVESVQQQSSPPPAPASSPSAVTHHHAVEQEQQQQASYDDVRAVNSSGGDGGGSAASANAGGEGGRQEYYFIPVQQPGQPTSSPSSTTAVPPHLVQAGLYPSHHHQGVSHFVASAPPPPPPPAPPYYYSAPSAPLSHPPASTVVHQGYYPLPPTAAAPPPPAHGYGLQQPVILSEKEVQELLNSGGGAVPSSSSGVSDSIQQHHVEEETSVASAVSSPSPPSPPPSVAASAESVVERPSQGNIAGGGDNVVAPPPSPPSPSPATSEPVSSPASSAPSTPEPVPDDDENMSASASDSKKPKRLGERLIDMGLISEDQLEIALKEQKQNGGLLGEILVNLNFLTESALAEVLAESAGAERFDAKTTMLDPQVIKMLPKEVAQRNKIIPVSIKDNTLYVAMEDVYNVIAIDQVRRYMPKNIEILPLYSTESEIQEMIDQYYDYEVVIDGILREIETGIRDSSDASSFLDGSKEGYVNPTVRLVNALLIDAIKQGASDIHFEPEGTFLRLRYRIDGQMQQIRSFHSDYWSAILVRIKIISGMNIAETRQPQDGRISFAFQGREVDFRVATQPTVHGENVVMRLLDKANAILPLEGLGFTEYNNRLLKKLLKRPEGIVIVTGPTGSGKTTTLYSILNYINSIDVNIMTLEDPVEYQLPLIRQTSIKEGTMDFVTGIKSLMRQDPDIIFIGEVRDEETAIMSVRAAMTGHQVFTTLHTNDAMGAIPRLNDIGVPNHMLAGALICIIAQRLARRLCTHCKEPYLATSEDCHILAIPAGEPPPTIYRAKGCDRCNNRGYKGRITIMEILQVDKGLDELIAANATRAVMMKHAVERGFISMAQDGIGKVLNGTIDVKELVNRIDMTENM